MGLFGFGGSTFHSKDHHCSPYLVRGKAFEWSPQQERALKQAQAAVQAAYPGRNNPAKAGRVGVPRLRRHRACSTLLRRLEQDRVFGSAGLHTF